LRRAEGDVVRKRRAVDTRASAGICSVDFGAVELDVDPRRLARPVVLAPRDVRGGVRVSVRREAVDEELNLLGVVPEVERVDVDPVLALDLKLAVLVAADIGLRSWGDRGQVEDARGGDRLHRAAHRRERG